MTLSIIIVSYNVKDFLEQCLLSVRRAISTLDAEVIIVDNDSPDQSAVQLSSLFPDFRFIVNDINRGFSKACNQGLSVVTGNYILFLNPDTIVPEDAFTSCIAFMDSHHDAGALGVRMINGRGIYLPESKRGFPSAWVSLWKMTGMATRFPRSRVFAGYYLGHLNEDEPNIIDVISGAFFFARRSTLEITGGFDERFFMYAEDIDLSIRVSKSGFSCYYFPGTTILHYKGESTVKDSDYVKQFYYTMSQFSEKYATGGFSKFLRPVIELGIRIKMRLTLGKKFEKQKTPPHILHLGPDESVKSLIEYMQQNPGVSYRVELKRDENNSRELSRVT